RVIGVERDVEALAQARAMVQQSGLSNVEIRAGDATNSGVDEASVDVVMMRHVLAHNGGREQAIVDHLARLVRPGGCVYLVDVDLTAIRMLDPDPDVTDLQERYIRLHRVLGNDPTVGLQVARFLDRAGLDVIHHSGQWSIGPRPAGMRPPAWA